MAEPDIVKGPHLSDAQIKTLFSRLTASLSREHVRANKTTNYDFTHPRRGMAIVISNEKFQLHGPRPYADVDITKMWKMFRKLHFDVLTFKDLTKDQILLVLENAAKQTDYHHQSDCFACVIGSHGEEKFLKYSSPHKREHVIYGTDKHVSTNKLTGLFSDSQCPGLRNKPKLFFIQACRNYSSPSRPNESGFDFGIDVNITSCQSPTHPPVFALFEPRGTPKRGAGPSHGSVNVQEASKTAGNICELNENKGGKDTGFSESTNVIRNKISPMKDEMGLSLPKDKEMSPTSTKGNEMSQTLPTDKEMSQTLPTDKAMSQTLPTDKAMSQILLTDKAMSQTLPTDKAMSQILPTDKAMSQSVQKINEMIQTSTKDKGMIKTEDNTINPTSKNKEVTDVKESFTQQTVDDVEFGSTRPTFSLSKMLNFNTSIDEQLSPICRPNFMIMYSSPEGMFSIGRPVRDGPSERNPVAGGFLLHSLYSVVVRENLFFRQKHPDGLDMLDVFTRVNDFGVKNILSTIEISNGSEEDRQKRNVMSPFTLEHRLVNDVIFKCKDVVQS
ncbi:uncharacterized protein LOC117323762 [Pecten maximus]|uniref:uncharacterized protein LOC117323762 n=1 Tax=Pecten maximus TaxID=6579 RepID=UPI0014588913|nr:uncharacterized protein LOC117323762 [Pecten maximus]